MKMDKYCVLFSTADWDAPYWTNKQHMAVELAKEGFQILYVESFGLRTPKLSSGRDLFRMIRRLKKGLTPPRKVQNNIWVLSPLVIPFKHDTSVVRFLNNLEVRFLLKRFLERNRFKKPLVWTYHPFILGIIDGWERGQLVYHCVDDLSAVPGIDKQAISEEEERLLAKADQVFTTSRTLEERCRKFNNNVHNFTNVVDVDHFSKAMDPSPIPREIQCIPHPRLLYMGALSDYKVDFDLLYDLMRENKIWHLILIGEEPEGQRNKILENLKKLENVHFLGYRPYNELPDYLRGVDVGLLPTLINDYTRSMFPMKYFEYLAAGLPVVSTPLCFTEDQTQGLLVGSRGNEFREAVEKQLERGRFSREYLSNFITQFSWKSRLEKMIFIINKK